NTCQWPSNNEVTPGVKADRPFGSLESAVKGLELRASQQYILDDVRF
ncbi:hypothetical protein CEXT_747011, partial [Caerostris extrusa]